MSRWTTRVVSVMLMAIGSMIVTLPGAAAPADAATSVIVVTSIADDVDVSQTDGVCQTAAGACTLRAAITTANLNTGDDRIEFNIPGAGVKTIQVGSSLPDVYDPTGRLVIDGYTQSDAAPNTAAAGSNARLRVELRGPATYGLRLTSAENTVRGLSIAGFTINLAIHFEQADGNVIAGNFIGPDASGAQVTSRSDGVHIWLGPDFNRIGGPSLADRNVISGNTRHGVLLEQGNTSRNTVQNNVIGLNPTLTARLQQIWGIDSQWGTWGNLIGGDNPGEGNLISGNSAGIDLSHSTQSNLILGNCIGTLGDGNSAAAYSSNLHGVLFKDNPQNNYIANNVIANSTGDGLWHRHNYTGPNSIVNNRIGVGSQGAALPNARYGIRLNGHDDIYYDNIIANNGEGGIFVFDETFVDAHTNFPPEQTLGNQIRYGAFYNNTSELQVDITPLGQNTDDSGDVDDGPHRLLNRPVFTGAGAGQIYGQACAGCEVLVYLSGSVAADGTVNVAGNGDAAAWIGTATASAAGAFSMADSRLAVGKQVWALGIDADGNTSEWTEGGLVIPATPVGITGNPAPAIGKVAPPVRPELPGPYVSELPAAFTCTQSAGTLSWADAEAATYYVFAITNGVEQYLGGHTTTALDVPNADSYRVEHWKFGGAIEASCAFTSGGAVFSCSVAGAALSWADAGASEYYVFATIGGVERYLGGDAGTSRTVQAADSYRVEHWQGNGATNAICDGAGVAAFTCSVSGGTLTWADAGAAEYYVFATSGGVEQYLGANPGPSLAVQSADSYRVEHWQGGAQTDVVCQGAGALVFSCSVAGSTLSWVDVDAAEYYVFATSGGAEQYLGGHAAIGLSVPAADSYRVEHWISGSATNAICG